MDTTGQSPVQDAAVVPATALIADTAIVLAMQRAAAARITDVATAGRTRIAITTAGIQGAAHAVHKGINLSVRKRSAKPRLILPEQRETRAFVYYILSRIEESAVRHPESGPEAADYYGIC
jgi:hypothetical protein